MEGLLTERGELIVEGVGRDRKKNVKSFQMLQYEPANPNSKTWEYIYCLERKPTESTIGM